MKRGLFTSCTAVSMGIAFAAAAQQVTVTGCAEAGVENGCIVMKDGDKLYNIARATPKPTANTFGNGHRQWRYRFVSTGNPAHGGAVKPDASKVCGNTQ
ncbi:hypothetical protein NKI13_21015 [Mesorhizobium australicum]|uniref:hypothetical protein n=1 Tax=Mesorhizobium australicum TaxID=536018 RepID=UPI003337EBDF